MLPERIDTERLHLRPFELTDADDVFAYASDEEWLRYLPLPLPYSHADAVQFIARSILTDWCARPIWAICIDDRAAGGINVRFERDFRGAEIGYSVARNLWGRGLATEAAIAIVAAAYREHPELERVGATADADNRGSQRVLEKLGMVHEGTLRSKRYIRGRYRDEVVYGLLRSGWHRGAPPR